MICLEFAARNFWILVIKKKTYITSFTDKRFLFIEKNVIYVKLAQFKVNFFFELITNL